MTENDPKPHSLQTSANVIDERAFAEWLASQAEEKTDKNIQVIVAALWPLVQQGKLKIKRVGYLRPSNIDQAKRAWAILALLVKRLRQAWPAVRLMVRADSGFCRHKMLSWCERHEVAQNRPKQAKTGNGTDNHQPESPASLKSANRKTRDPTSASKNPTLEPFVTNPG